jgi:quinol monooxygenase YgiN
MLRAMVISTLRLVPSPKRHCEVLEILRSVIGPTEIQPGCLSCRVCEESGPDRAVVFRAHFKTPSALREHILSDLYPSLLAACELSSQPPEVCFHHVSRTQGMELIEQLRGHAEEHLPVTPPPRAS